LTAEGTRATLEALDAGAVDFMPKRPEDFAADSQDFGRELCGKIRAVARRAILPAEPARSDYSPVFRPRSEAVHKPAPRLPAAAPFSLSGCRMVAIGASTGGPSVLREIVTKLPKNFPAPVLIIQHMPAAFTGPFAKRLEALSRVAVKEAEDGDVPLPGHVYIAPGGRQMLLAEEKGRKVLCVKDGVPAQHYKPSIDLSLLSVAEHYGRHSLAIILTGMGADGCEGAVVLSRQGASVWAQDEASSVVYGMPQAVAEAGCAERILPFPEIARLLASGA